MRAGNVFLVLQQGATYRAKPIWLAGNPLTPVDLTGCTARMQLRASFESPSALLDIGTTPNASGSLVLGGVSGEISIHIDSASIPIGTGVWDLEIYHQNGDVSRVLEGKWSVSLEVTR